MGRKIKFNKTDKSFTDFMQEIYNDIQSQKDMLVTDIEDRIQRHIEKFDPHAGEIEVHEDTSLSKSNADIYKQLDSLIKNKIDLLKIHKAFLNETRTEDDDEVTTDDFNSIRKLVKDHKSDIKD